MLKLSGNYHMDCYHEHIILVLNKVSISQRNVILAITLAINRDYRGNVFYSTHYVRSVILSAMILRRVSIPHDNVLLYNSWTYNPISLLQLDFGTRHSKNPLTHQWFCTSLKMKPYFFLFLQDKYIINSQANPIAAAYIK